MHLSTQSSPRIKLLLTLILISFVSALADLNDFLHDTMIYHINSVTSSPMLFLLTSSGRTSRNSISQYWTNKVGEARTDAQQGEDFVEGC